MLEQRVLLPLLRGHMLRLQADRVADFRELTARLDQRQELEDLAIPSVFLDCPGDLVQAWR